MDKFNQLLNANDRTLRDTLSNVEITRLGPNRTCGVQVKGISGVANKLKLLLIRLRNQRMLNDGTSRNFLQKERRQLTTYRPVGCTAGKNIKCIPAVSPQRRWRGVPGPGDGAAGAGGELRALLQHVAGAALLPRTQGRGQVLRLSTR